MENHKLEHLKTSRQMACDGWVYSLQRMDLLIISISGAGIYVILETIKYSFEHSLCNVGILKSAGIVFVLSMIINFISQWTGQKANVHHISYIDKKIEAGDKPTPQQQSKIDTTDSKAAKWNKFTNNCNFISVLLMLVGLMLTIMYFSIIL